MTTARHRGPGRTVGWRHAALAFFLALPPALRVALPYLPPPAAASAPAAPGGEEAATGQALRTEVAALREDVRRARSELELRGMAPPDARYTILGGSVLPASDPSPTRSALWVWIRGGAPAPQDGAVLATPVAATAAGEGVLALAGRVHRAYPATPIVRVRLLLDRDLRVRFRHPSASGMLFGSGQSDLEGHALLYIRHLSATAELHEGEPVFTEEGDSVYPPGILIGFLEPRQGSADGERLVVRSAARLDDLATVLVAVDTQSQAVARLRAIDKDSSARRGGDR